MQGKLIKGSERLVRINKGGVAKEKEKNKTKYEHFFWFLLVIKTSTASFTWM